tara:strand:+ start:544 stop:915 length:372 start_codon:yes stop_codon:yes gene_type:complete
VKKLLSLVPISILLIGCSENSFNSCVDEVQGLLYESWEKNYKPRRRLTNITDEQRDKYCQEGKLTFYTIDLTTGQTKFESCGSYASFAELAPTNDDEKRIYEEAIEEAIKNSRAKAIMRCSET